MFPPLQKNADLENVLALLNHPHGLAGWLFALYENHDQRDLRIEQLRAQTARPTSLIRLSAIDPNIFSFRFSHAAGAVLVLGLELAGPEAWGYLEYGRELLAAKPYFYVFWITPGFREKVNNHIPNFWAQRSGTFDLR